MREGQTECEWSADAHHTNRKKVGGVDPIGFLCDVLSNESAPDQREEVAKELLPLLPSKARQDGAAAPTG